ncbi:hypothetical protein BGW38_001565 [Lunasporangiospora selenospora]|uniref:Beta-lactamase-related domain-containing protein n=1 Tax=Lunasporangiospora selenospora TaxID=979761 RepID=A0A9P6G3R9_9FUNG|nr:hypothetical protein BGW38_001565 [Lunasporangiospora selenospora]
MADKGEFAAAGAAPTRRFFFPRLSLFQWFIRLLPAVVYALWAYSRQGPFQSSACIHFSIGCPRSSANLSGLLDRPEHYGQVVRYYGSLFQAHEDLGGTFAVFVDGKPVIDVHAGSKDLKMTEPYTNRTLQQVYSSGKMVEGLVIARLVQRGLLDYEKRITEYWPEFGQNGKEDVRLVDLMVHESGVFFPDDDGLETPMAWADLLDEETFSERLARQKHEFGGEATRAYMAISRGWYLNEIVRRVDPHGRTISQIAEQELMQDYKDVELYYSQLPNEQDWDERLSPMHDYPRLRLLGRLVLPTWFQTNKYVGHPGLKPLHALVSEIILGPFKKTIASRAVAPSMARLPHLFRTKEAHAVESTSFSLKTNAHSLAKLAAMMANKGASLNPEQEPDLLDRETYELATTFHSLKPCKVTTESLPLSRGGWVKSRNFYGDGPLKGVEVQGWAGAGGSLVVWIEELNIGFSYVTNAFGPPETVLGDYRSKILLDRVVYARKSELGLLEKK